MNLNIIYWVVVIVISLICVIASIIARFAKNGKIKSKAEQVAKYSQDFIALLNGAKACMFNTETKTNFSAEEKHAYCKTLIIDYCLKHNIDYEEYDLDEVIEYFMEVGNKINARQKEQENNIN